MIYIDELLLINFLIDFFILNVNKNILKINVKNRRLILSALFGEITTIVFFIKINTVELIIIKLFTSLILIIIAYGYTDIKTTIKNIIYFHIASFLLGGILYYFKSENIINYGYYLLLIPIILNIYKYFVYNLKNIINTRYKVTIYLNNGKILYLNGFMDTGNSLLDPYSNKKVIIIDKKVNENFYLIPYKTINTDSLMKCFKPKKVYIDGIGQRKDIVIGITNKKFKGYNCLLNYKLMEE